MEQVQLFQYLYERYTASFGYNSSEEIITVCEITRQTISQDPANTTIASAVTNRRIQEEVFSLSLRFTMEYRSYSAQYNISDYGVLFKAFINQNTTKVAEDMARIGLPTVVAGEVIMVGLISCWLGFLCLHVIHLSLVWIFLGGIVVYFFLSPNCTTDTCHLVAFYFWFPVLVSNIVSIGDAVERSHRRFAYCQRSIEEVRAKSWSFVFM